MSLRFLQKSILLFPQSGFLFFPSFFFLVAALFFTESAQTLAAHPPAAVQGQLDLREWNLDKDGSVELKGEWAFYWKQLLTPEHFKSKSLPAMNGFFNVPGFWNGYDDHGGRLKGDGFATFHLKVKLNPRDHTLALRLEDQATAYRLWVNGKLLMSNGVVAESSRDAIPHYLVRIAAVDQKTESLDLILQISDFHLHNGGPYRPISLGVESKVRKRQLLLWAVDLLSCGILIIVGFHHLIFYLLRRRELTHLHFGLFCLLWGIHVPFWGTGGKFITVLFPHFNWTIAHKLDLLTWYPTVPLLVMFMASLYPAVNSPKFIRLYQYASIPFFLIVLLMPPGIGQQTLFFYEIYALLGIPPIILILHQALGWKRKGAKFIIFGFALFIFTAINDILYNMLLINTFNLIPAGLVGLIFSQSIELARRYTNALHSSESLTIQLKNTNTVLLSSNEELRLVNLSLEENLRLKTALEEQRKKKQQALLQAEKNALEKLRYQLNPHFLFNALTSIRGAVGRHPDLARDMVSKLAEFCRCTLVYGKNDLVSVAEAVELNRLYLDMERIRMGEYLTVTTNLDPSAEHVTISSLLLQPLVENAVKYGRLTSPKRLEIVLNAGCTRPGRLLLEVINSGSWVEPDAEDHVRSTGIGLENLRQRLEKLYPGAYNLNVKSGDGKVTVSVAIPAGEKEE